MKKKIFGILLLLILIIYSIVFFKKRTTEREIKNRKYLFEIKSSNNWRIKKITDKHLLYQGNTNKIFPNSNIENEGTLRGPIFYDSINKKSWIEVTAYNNVSTGVAEKDKNWICFDERGNFKIYDFIDASKINAIPIPEVSLSRLNKDSKNSININDNYYKFNNNKPYSNIYVQKYIKLKDKYQNPLKGIGNASRNNEVATSYGIAFMSVVFNNDTIKFKTNAYMSNMGLSTYLNIYALDTTNISKNSFLLLNIDDNSKDNGLYILMSKKN